GDARLEIERTLAGHEWTSAISPASARTRYWLMPVCVACAAGLLAAGWLLAGSFNRAAPSPAMPAYHVSAAVPAKPNFVELVGIAPNAAFLVYTAWPDLPPESNKPAGLLMVRRLDRNETYSIEGTEGARSGALSPDGRWIAYASVRDRAATKVSLKKVALENGRPVGRPETVCDLPTGANFLLGWSSEREIVFAPAVDPTVYAVAAAGGTPREVLREELSKGVEGWGGFQPLVAGKSVLATRWHVQEREMTANTEVIDLGSGKRTLVLANAMSAQYLPESGVLLAMRASRSSLIAVRFDPETLQVEGEPVTVWSGQPSNALSVSHSGTLAIATQASEPSSRGLAWMDEQGRPQRLPGAGKAFGIAAVSPDGKRALVRLDLLDQTEIPSEVWVQDLIRGTSTRVPLRGGVLEFIWSHDGQRVTYGSLLDGVFSIWDRRVDGTGEPVKLYSTADSRTLVVPRSWSPDGRVLAVVQVDLPTDTTDVLMLEQDASTKTWIARPYLNSPVREEALSFSPNGALVQYTSAESGRTERYVKRFSGTQSGADEARAERVQVSTNGSGHPGWWSPDGKELRYVDGDGQVMSVQIETEPSLSASAPTLLYSIKDLKVQSPTFGPDGRLMVVMLGDDEQVTKIDLVVNFISELRAKLTPAR
ncbi:MAG: PD40 domain-containing protein, partial [Phycisphaerae bacterium]|nr:PD40 domain-containing protein [Phycisphaerae bacterium]